MAMTTTEQETMDKKATEEREKMEADNKKKAEEKTPTSSTPA
jgi:hypothetical protein